MIEKTLILIKPDGVRRGLIGNIIERVERKGLVFEELQLLHANREQATNHYSDYTQAPFFESLIEFITSGPLIAAVVSGERAIAAFRQLAGATDSVAKAAPGSIRGDFGLSIQQNLVHGSDSPENAAREIAVWFPHHQID